MSEDEMTKKNKKRKRDILISFGVLVIPIIVLPILLFLLSDFSSNYLEDKTDVEKRLKNMDEKLSNSENALGNLSTPIPFNDLEEKMKKQADDWVNRLRSKVDMNDFKNNTQENIIDSYETFEAHGLTEQGYRSLCSITIDRENSASKLAYNNTPAEISRNNLAQQIIETYYKSDEEWKQITEKELKKPGRLSDYGDVIAEYYTNVQNIIGELKIIFGEFRDSIFEWNKNKISETNDIRSSNQISIYILWFFALVISSIILVFRILSILDRISTKKLLIFVIILLVISILFTIGSFILTILSFSNIYPYSYICTTEIDIQNRNNSFKNFNEKSIEFGDFFGVKCESEALLSLDIYYSKKDIMRNFDEYKKDIRILTSSILNSKYIVGIKEFKNFTKDTERFLEMLKEWKKRPECLLPEFGMESINGAIPITENTIKVMETFLKNVEKVLKIYQNSENELINMLNKDFEEIEKMMNSKIKDLNEPLEKNDLKCDEFTDVLSKKNKKLCENTNYFVGTSVPISLLILSITFICTSLWFYKSSSLE